MDEAPLEFAYQIFHQYKRRQFFRQFYCKPQEVRFELENGKLISEKEFDSARKSAIERYGTLPESVKALTEVVPYSETDLRFYSMVLNQGTGTKMQVIEISTDEESKLEALIQHLGIDNYQ